MRLLLGAGAYGLALLALLVRPTRSLLIPQAPDHLSYAVHAGAACIYFCLYLLYVYERRNKPWLYDGKWSVAPFVIVGGLLAAATFGGLSIPTLIMTSNERSAASALAAIAEAQERFRSEDLDSDGLADYAAGLDELSEKAGGELPRPLAEALLAKERKPYRGYLFGSMGGTWGDGGYDHETSFGVEAVPQVYGKTGRASLFVTEDGAVWSRDLPESAGEATRIEPRDPAAEGWSRADTAP